MLVARIERGEFDHVALIMPLDDEDLLVAVLPFRPPRRTSAATCYVLVGQVDGYYVYRPRRS